MRHNQIPFMLAAISLVDCGSTSDAIGLAKNAAGYVSATDPVLRGAYESEQRFCLTKPTAEQAPCVYAVREKWAPVRKALTAIRESWCKVDPATCAEQDALNAKDAGGQ